jgi:hypothetical protein
MQDIMSWELSNATVILTQKKNDRDGPLPVSQENKLQKTFNVGTMMIFSEGL